MELEYSNREISHMFNDVKTTLGEIKEQTTRTNGRVTNLEQWRWFTIGGMSVLTTIVVPILAWALYVLSSIDHQIHSTIDEALSDYEKK